MTLAAARAGLRKLRTELRATAGAPSSADAGGGGGGGIGAGNGGSARDLSLVILSSATVAALHLGELLLPVRVRGREGGSERGRRRAAAVAAAGGGGSFFLFLLGTFKAPTPFEPSRGRERKKTKKSWL